MSLHRALLARTDDDRVGLFFEDRQWTWRECLVEMSSRASFVASLRQAGPFHVGMLMGNTPDFHFWLGGLVLAGATMVGVNPTRRGAELAADIRSTNCQLIVVDEEHAELLDGLDLGAANHRIVLAASAEEAAALSMHRVQPPVEEPPADSTLLLLFTSGTSGGAAKAVIRSRGRVELVGATMIATQSITADDVNYISMPLFHSNALFTAWVPSVLAGSTIALRRKFSASAFLQDVRRYGATYFNYVGKPLSYILATPERDDDADNPLRRGMGNEANEADLARFAERFGCPLTDGYGQSETGASIGRIPNMPHGALGVAAPEVIVVDPNGKECPRAEFDADGRITNAELATGEIVNTGATMFEGYYNNPEANAERMRNGWYWTGDLAYRDDAGFFCFAGRTADWIRVDGENFAAAPVERIVMRFPRVVLAAAYGVPDPRVGDRLMVTLSFDPLFVADESFGAEFADFLRRQPDLGTKWAPTFVRVTEQMPMNPTNKILKRTLVGEAWRTDDSVWIRVGDDYVPFTPEARAEWEAAFGAT